MQTELTPTEMAMVLDGLSALPLQRSYNLFNRLVKEYQDYQNAPAPADYGEPECSLPRKEEPKT